MVAIGWDGEDLIAFALGQELMLALRHAVSCPQKVIWAYGQRGVKRHSMWTDMGGAQRLPSIASTERPFGRRTGWAIFWVMPASAPAIRTWLDRPCVRSEEHTSELQSLMSISYAVFRLQKKTTKP